MNKKLKTLLKWILYIVVPVLLFKVMFFIIYPLAGNLPFQLVGWMGSSPQELIYTHLQEAFLLKVKFIMYLSTFFTVFICSIYLMVKSRISFIKSIVFNFIASLFGLLIGSIILFISIENNPVKLLENIHPELIPLLGLLSIMLMTAISIIKTRRANKAN